MFERFTEKAREAVRSAQDDARQMHHSYVGSEHLLLGLLHDQDCLAAQVLTSLGLTLDKAHLWVRDNVASGEEPSHQNLPFTPRAKEALELALREAIALDHNYIGTEHVLLGVCSVSESEALGVLRGCGIEPDQIRPALIELLSDQGALPAAGRPRRFGSRRHVARVVGGERSALETGFRVGPDDELVRLLMGAAAQALETGRTQMTIADVEAALERRRGEQPPDAASGG